MHKFLFLIFLFPSLSWGQGKIAMVKFIRGEAFVTSQGKSVGLKLDDWISRGSIIKTAEKSFIKLIFIDKSIMNLGPNSEMRVEDYSGKDSGVIGLVKGKIRSQVTKDYLHMQDKGKSKLFIKTSNAVMGVRGTDFLISTNGVNTATILFEGEIMLNKFDPKEGSDSSRLEEIVDRGVRIMPGEFSVVDVERPLPTVPALLNVQQRERLERNVDMDSEREPSNAEDSSKKNVVPEGLNGKVVSNDPEFLKKQIADLAEKTSVPAATSAATPEGFVKGDLVKPANGSIVHIDSGVIIPPGKGAVLDPHTNTFIPDKENGKISSNGNYVPPKNVEITTDGKVLVAAKNDKGETVVQTVKLPPVVSNTGHSVFSSEHKPPINPMPISSAPNKDMRAEDFKNTHISGGVQANTQESAAAQGMNPTTIIFDGE